jgi:DNA polymerase III sliding clamp (beta) subunit (PCNA family)
MKTQLLLDILEKVKPGLAKGETGIEQSHYLVFTDGFVETYNDETSVKHPTGLNLSGSVSAPEFYTLLKRITQDELEICTSDRELLISAGRIKAGLTLQAEIALPAQEAQEMSEPKKYRKLPGDFYQALKFTATACDTDPSKNLSCVHVNQSGFLEGSDNHRFARWNLSAEMPLESFLIPARSVRELLKLTPEKIALSTGWVHFRSSSGTEISFRRYAEKYPDTSGILRQKTPNQLTFPRSILEILERAAAFFKRDDELEECITLSFGDGRVKISSESEAGWFSERVKVEFSGDPVDLYIAPTLLKDILAQSLECSFNDRVLRFTGENWTYLVSLMVGKG